MQRLTKALSPSSHTLALGLYSWKGCRGGLGSTGGEVIAQRKEGSLPSRGLIVPWEEDPMAAQQRQLRAARSLEEFPELGGGGHGGWSQGAWVRGTVARGVSPAPLHPPHPAFQLMAQIQPLQQQRLKNRGWIPPLGRGVHQPGATG